MDAVHNAVIKIMGKDIKVFLNLCGYIFYPIIYFQIILGNFFFILPLYFIILWPYFPILFQYKSELYKILNFQPKLFKDHHHLLLLERSIGVLKQIEMDLDKLRSSNNDTFLRVINSRATEFCGKLVHNDPANVSMSHRILPNLYAITEDEIQYYDRHSSGHITLPQVPQQRQLQIHESGADIAIDKRNGRIVCRLGVYFAMCKVLHENLFDYIPKSSKRMISQRTKAQAVSNI